MGLPVLWVWTHDSIGVGEDGPTHQPIEHYASLRAIPHLWVIRPGDPNETAEAWRVALEREDGPVALLLSRQNVEVLDRSDLGAAKELERGGYVLWDSADSPTPAPAPPDTPDSPDTPAPPDTLTPPDAPELILISTGAEVPPTLAAGRTLAGQGTRVRVVSMPCIECFEAQTQEYRDSVLPPATTARLAVEPGASMSWWKWVGTAGDVLGIDRFGASAPGSKVLEELGFTAEGIFERARALLER
jgi:transketolase